MSKNNDKLYIEANNYFDNSEYKKSLNILLSLAKNDYIPAKDMLGYIYLNGYGVEINEKKAISWWEVAASSNSIYAQFQLGCLFIRKGNVNDGLDLLNVAKENNSSDAIYLLAGYYYHGTYVEENKELAISLYEKATLLGHEDAAKDLMMASNIQYSRFNTLIKGIFLSIKIIKNKFFDK